MKKISSEQIGENIRKLRIRQGLTQLELAQQVGITQPMIGHIERGAKFPSLAIVLSLSEIFSCTIDELCRNNKED